MVFALRPSASLCPLCLDSIALHLPSASVATRCLLLETRRLDEAVIGIDSDFVGTIR